ncbi:hypothetical protein WG66_013169 [Moniliophthora roreri]|nr:hypothetical protein WG66_013169 [Moniliophthora roreri]
MNFNGLQIMDFYSKKGTIFASDITLVGWVGWVEQGVSVKDVLRKERRRYEGFEEFDTGTSYSNSIEGLVIDGSRIHDEMPVTFKLIFLPTKRGDHSLHGAQVLETMQYLASSSLRNDPHNPYPHLLDSFSAELPKGGQHNGVTSSNNQFSSHEHNIARRRHESLGQLLSSTS